MNDQTVGSPAGGQGVVNSDATAVGPGAAEHAQGLGLPASDASQSPAGGPPAAPAEGYVAGSGFWEGFEIPSHDATAYSYVGEVFAATGVRPESGDAGMKWLEDALGSNGDLKPVQGSHSYDLTAYRNLFTAEDQPVLQHFLNSMAAAKVTQRELETMLTVYLDGQRRIAKQEAAAASTPAALRKPGNTMSLEEIRQVMRTDRKRYNRDDAMQARYRALLDTAGR
jgi:hypothetical protein